jgi:Fe-S cluster biosynthesis and repair protein YggX
MLTITCSRCGETKEAMPYPPFVRQGAFIQAHVCPDCWQAWMEESVRLINHLGLNLMVPADAQRLQQYMREFLHLPTS